MLHRLLSMLRSWFAPERKAARPHRSTPEPLEARIAPATFVNAHIVTYTDSAGAHVTIDSSSAIFTKANVNSILTFNTGSVNGSNAPQQLESINIGNVGSILGAGDNLSVTTHSGLVNVGVIKADFNLGHVTVQGDLGAIDCGFEAGAGANSVGLASLNVHTLGAEGVTTQAAGSGATITSTIYGAVGSITVQRDMVNAQIDVLAVSGVNNGTINAINIGGSIIGGSVANSGSITSGGNVGSIKIGGNLQGGSGTDSGSLQITGSIGSLNVGNLIGYSVAKDTKGLGMGSASVTTGKNLAISGGIGSLVVRGNIQGGDGEGSAQILQTSFTSGDYGTVKVGGQVKGGSGQDSGQIDGSSFGSVTIGRGVVGSSGADSGDITTPNGIGSLTILSGGIIGGTNTDSGSVMAGTAPDGSGVESVGSIVIHGDITGVAAAGSVISGTGQVYSGVAVDSFTLFGSLVGSAASQSGALIGVEAIDHVIIRPDGATTGSILGGSGSGSGEISALSLGTVSISGEILGAATGTGKIVTNTTIGDLVLGGSLIGGAGSSSGTIAATGIHTILIGGEIEGSGASSGTIAATGSIGSVTVNHGIFGGKGEGSGVVSTGAGAGFGENLGLLAVAGGITGGGGAGSGQVTIGGVIGSVRLNNSVITGGAGAASGGVLATDDINLASIGSLKGGSGAGSGQLSAGGNITNLSFGGSVSGLVNVGGVADVITVHGDIDGTNSASSGLFLIGGGVESFTIHGSVRGGSGQDSGSIFAGLDGTSLINSLTISGGIIGGAGTDSGQVNGGGGIGHASVSDIIGGSGISSGAIVTGGPIGSIFVAGADKALGVQGIIGGAGSDSGRIFSGSTIGAVFVHGLVKGGKGYGSGAIASSSIFASTGDIQGNIGSIIVTGSVIGGAGAQSGQLSAAGNLNGVTVGGSVMGGSASGSGAIVAGAYLTGVTGGDIATLVVNGALDGGNISSGSVDGSGYIQAGHIGSATLGSIHAGAVAAGLSVINDGAIRAASDIATLIVKGSVTGTASNAVAISAIGQLSPGKSGDLAFGKISVGGNVTYADFLAGYGSDGQPVSTAGAASIGSVVVGGNWSGSNLVAGVSADNAQAQGKFGSLNDTLINPAPTINPTIASIIIKGQVVNAPTPGKEFTYGFVARKIDALTIHGVAQPVSFGLIDEVGTSTDTDLQDVAG